MSLLGWFSRKSDEELTSTTLPHDSTRPPELGSSSRRAERNARRERLYGVVREAMVNAGVLSSAYRFKVLSLDGRGRQFLAMIDLAGDASRPAADLTRIEAAMVQAAKVQHGIVLKAVYWRQGAAAGAHAVAAEPTRAERSAPAPAASAAAASKPSPAPAKAPEPSKQDRMAALEQALADGDTRPAARAFDGTAVQGPQSYTLLTGFEDTELGVQPAQPAAGSAAGKA